ncbi:hypothetical protein BC827DRAFT_1195145 [Russula dissimulans]|nr:hypothetical protein BC827DRAFT_1195145 [Russula dissimulans]
MVTEMSLRVAPSLLTSVGGVLLYVPQSILMGVVVKMEGEYHVMHSSFGAVSVWFHTTVIVHSRMTFQIFNNFDPR